MQNLDLKQLKSLAIMLAIILAVIIIASSFSKKPPKVDEVIVYETINNNERVAHYGDDLYCCVPMVIEGKKKSVLMRLPIDFDDDTPREIIDVFDTASILNKTLEFKADKIFYENRVTCIYDLAANKISPFCEGEIQFMLEPDAFVMLENGDIFKGTYYLSTYMTKYFEKLAEGNFVKFGEDEKYAYYYSSTGSNTIIISLDKENLRIFTMDNLENTKMKLEDCIATDDYIYEIVSYDNKKYIRKIPKELVFDNNLEIVEKEIGEYDIIDFVDFKYTKSLNINSKKDISSNDVYFYATKIVKPASQYLTSAETIKTLYKYDIEQDIITEYTGLLNERFVNDYSGDINGNKIELYRDNKKITEIETKFSELSKVNVIDVNVVEDKEKYYLYYEVEAVSSSGDIEVIFARTFLDGGESKRINIYK